MSIAFLNWIAILIPGIFLAVYALETWADLMNLRCLGHTAPEELQRLYDPAQYERSRQYQREKTRFELLRRTVDLALLFTFVGWGGFNRVDQLARSMNAGPIWTGLAFAATLSTLKLLAGLPFSAYSTFSIEERFGFNRQSPGQFVSDLLKSVALGAGLGGLVFAGLIAFFEKLGPTAWLWAWLAITLFQLLLTFLAPSVFMPLFNRFSPLPAGPLYDSIQTYARSQNFELTGIFSMDGSKRSTKANAFFTGFGRFRRLVLFDTLIEKQTIPELTAVLAHEIGHFKLHHILKGIALAILSSGMILWIISLLMNNEELFYFFRVNLISTYGSLILISIVLSPLLRLVGIPGNALSRKHEFAADAFAVQTNGHREDLINALKKLSRDHLSHLTPHPLKVWLDYTHPPLWERIQAMRRLPQ